MSTVNGQAIIKYNVDRKIYYSLPKNMREDVKRKMASEYKKVDGEVVQDCIRGLTPDQEKYLLPSRLSVSASSDKFEDMAKDYWANWFFMTPPENPEKTLNIGYDLKKVMIDGQQVEIEIPHNFEHYVIYKMALQSSICAKTEEDMDFIDNFDFILIDTKKEKEKEVSMFQAREEATTTYVTLTSNFEGNKEKIQYILELLNDDKDVDVFNIEEIDAKILLRQIADQEPVKNAKGEFVSNFVQKANSSTLEEQAILSSALRSGTVSIEGDTYFYGELALGRGKKETIAFLKDSKNNETLLKLKSASRIKQKQKINN